MAKKNILWIGLFLLLIAGNAWAQNSGSSSILKKLEFGGNLGLAFGSQQGSVEVAPSVGMEVVKNLHVGVRLGYNYSYMKTSMDKLSSHSLNLGVYARYIVFMGFYLQGEYNYYRIYSYSNIYPKTVSNAESLMAGAGYRQAITQNSFAYFTLLWDFFIDRNSINANNPVIQAGVGFRF